MKTFKKIGLFFVFAFLVLSPVTTLADEPKYETSTLDQDENLELIDRNIKYFKTVTTYDNEFYDISSQNVLNSVYNAKSVTTEITEEEYNSASSDESIEVNATTTIETTYKIMDTSLSKNGDYYRYQNVVNWKNFPAVRDYDIIGIGFYGTVKPSKVSFESWKCSKSQGCLNSKIYFPQTFSNGSSATFILSDWTDLTSMRISYIIDVEKVNSSNTVTRQAAFGDYAHSIKNNGVVLAIKHKVVQNSGIVLDESVRDRFDSIDEADVYWSGTW